MRIYRLVPVAFARHLRGPRSGSATVNSLNGLSVSLRLEPAASRSFWTHWGSAIQPKSSTDRAPASVAQQSAFSKSSPAFSLLETLIEHSDQESRSSLSHSTPPAIAHTEQKDGDHGVETTKLPSIVKRNRTLENAIKKRNYLDATKALHALLGPWDPTSQAYPVYAQSYNHLLSQWSQLCAKQARVAGGKQVDLAPMLALLREMVSWKRASSRSFNTALVACQRVDALDAGEEVLEMMKQSGRPPSAFSYTVMISCCARLAQKHRGRRDLFIADAERLFNELVESDANVSIEAVNAMLFAYRTGRGRSSAAVQLIERAIDDWGLHPDSSTIATLVICLLKDKIPLEGARWIEYALKHCVPMDDSLIASVMDQCRRESHWDKLDSLRIQLQERGVAQKDPHLKQVFKHGRLKDPHSTTLSGSFIHSSTSTPKELKTSATMSIKEVSERLLRGQRVMMSKAEWTDMFKHGKIEEVDKLMRLLFTPDLLPPHKVPRALLNTLYLVALGSAGQWWRITGALDEMIAKTPGEVPVTCFNAGIRGCTQAGRLHEALLIRDRMVQNGTKPNRQTYDTLIQCCALVGSVETATRLFQKMERSGIKTAAPDLNAVLKTIATAVHRLIEASQDESAQLDVPASDLSNLAVYALHFFQDVTSKYEDMVITEGTLMHLFRSFLGAAEVFDAVDYREFEEFAKHEDDSSETRAEWIHLSNAIQQLCREAPLRVVSPRVINIGIDFFQRRGEPDSAFELFNTMISRGITPTPDSIRLLFAACSNGEENAQLGIFFLEHLIGDASIKDNNKLSQAVASEALSWAGRMHTTDNDESSALVDIVYEKLMASGLLKRDGTVYRRVVAVFGNDGNLVQAQRMAERMLSETGGISLDVANRLLQACSVARTPIAALKTLAWIRSHGLQPDRTSYNNVLNAVHRFQERERRFDRDVTGNGDGAAEFDDDWEGDDGSDDEDDLNEDVDTATVQGRHRVEFEKTHDRRSQLETDFNGVLDNLLATMMEERVFPDGRTFEYLISIASRRGELRRVLELFDTIKANAIQQQVNVSALLWETTIMLYLDACSALANTNASDAANRVDEVRSLLSTWYLERGQQPSAATIHRLLQACDALGQWQNAVAVLKNVREDYGVTPNVEMVTTVMTTCNNAGQHKVAEQIFVTMEQRGSSGERIYPTAACYVEAIYAVEQQAKWIQASQLFMEMQKKCAADDLRPALLQRIALGRYAEGRKRPDY